MGVAGDASSIRWRWRKWDELSADELHALAQLRQQVFVVEQNCPYLDLDGLDKQAIHLLAWHGDDLVGTLRLFPSYAPYQGMASLGRVCTAASARKTGIGRALMSQALDYAAKHFPHQPIKISAQEYLQSFYESLGFVMVSSVYLEDDIPHIAMVKQEYSQ